MGPLDRLECKLFEIMGDVDFVVALVDIYRDGVECCTRDYAELYGVDPDILRPVMERALVPHVDA